MKWGRKKSLLSSSSSSTFMSWVAKFKQMSIKSEPKQGKTKWKGKANAVPVSLSKCGSSATGSGSGRGRFYAGDGDGFWNLSFRRDSVDVGKKSRSGLRSVWYDSDDEMGFQPSSNCHGCDSSVMRRMMRNHEQTKMFSDMVSDVRNMRGLTRNGEILPDSRGKVAGIKTPRMRTIEREDCKSAPSDSIKHHHISSKNSRKSCLRRIDEDGAFDRLPEWQKMSKGEKQGRPLYISRDTQRKGTRTKQHSKVRVYSPRTASKVETCKIKALEDMKKARLKTDKKGKERAVESHTGLDRFAVVKCTYDPQKDLRDSMIEMIIEKRISHPEELEELLACYLTLNSDEYHDLIIKVFRQVWFEMNQFCSDSELQNEKCCYDQPHFS